MRWLKVNVIIIYYTAKIILGIAVSDTVIILIKQLK